MVAKQTDRAVTRMKVSKIRRKHGSVGCHSVRSAKHRAPHRDEPRDGAQKHALARCTQGK